MWIITRDYGVINTDQCKRISSDHTGKILTDDGQIISEDLSALSTIMKAIKNNDDYVEVN